MTCAIDETHDPALKSWVPGADGHRDFPIQNLPYGIVSLDDDIPRPATAIGEMVLDLAAIQHLLPQAVRHALTSQTLNALLALPECDRLALRRRLSELLSDDAYRAVVQSALHPATGCTMHLPCAIGDYTDFYVGIHHATNIGRQFRPDNPLLPNYKWVPIGYHGRASSVRPSGVPVLRPVGQRKPIDADTPTVGPSTRLDYELELGAWIGRGNDLGTPIPIGAARRHIAGFCLLNDWSARDFQAWEYQPLGPFLSKNFHSTVSAWVVTAEAMAPYWTAQPARPENDPRPLPYLWDDADQAAGAVALDLEVTLQSATMRDAGIAPVTLSRGTASNMYWTFAQMIAHHASNGCNLNTGDLLGSGTISSPGDGGRGSLIEITRGGTEPIVLPNGESRTFLEDGDTVSLSAKARAEGRVAIGFGACTATILPARP